MLYVLNLGESEGGPRLHEIEEQYRGGALAGRRRDRGHGGVRQDRGGARRACRSRNSANIFSSYGLGESGLDGSSPPPTRCWG